MASEKLRFKNFQKSSPLAEVTQNKNQKYRKWLSFNCRLRKVVDEFAQ